MATTTRSTIRQDLAKATGFFLSSTTTSAGNAGGTTVVDTGIVKYETAYLQNKWLLLTSGSSSGEARRISSVSTSTITVTSAFSAQVATSVTYEVMPFDPTMMHDAITQATRDCYPDLHVRLRDETLVVDNLLSNWDFETFSSTFTNWSNIGTPTLAQSTRAVHGTYSASITASGATEGIEQNIFTSLNRLEAVGRTLHVRGWTYGTVADAVRLRVTFDGSTYTNASYNTGDAEWNGPNSQYIDVTIPADMTEATISCEVTDTNVGLFDVVVAWVEPVTRYTIPTSFVNGPHRVLMQAIPEEPDGPYYQVSGSNMPQPGRILRLEGMGRLTAPTADATTIEVDNTRADLVVAKAAHILFTRSMVTDRGERDDRRQDADYWEARYQELRSRGGIRMIQPSADARNDWGVSEDASGRYLLLNRGRG